MNIEHLRLFIRVAVLANISQAGKELGLSAAVASAHMSKLEQDLGVRLVHRTTRRVSLTAEGEDFLPFAEQVLESVDQAKASVGVGSLTPQGKLRVAASASFGRLHLLPALPAFRQQYPDLQLDLHLSDSVLDMVEGGFDIAVRDASLKDSSLVARKLAPVNRILCASPDYLATHGVPTSPAQLTELDGIALIGLEAWTFNTEQGPATITPNIIMRTDNGEAARDAAVNGMGLTICSTWCCYQQLLSGELVEVLPDYPLLSDTAIWAVYPSTRQIAPKVRAFIDFFAQRFGDQPYWTDALS